VKIQTNKAIDKISVTRAHKVFLACTYMFDCVATLFYLVMYKIDEGFMNCNLSHGNSSQNTYLQIAQCNLQTTHISSTCPFLPSPPLHMG